MRAFWLCIVALGLAVSPAMAGTGAGGDADSAGNGAANTPAKPDPASKSSASNSSIENQLQQLRDLLQSQSQQLQQQDEQIKEQKEQMQTLQDQLTASHANGDGTTSWVAGPVNSPLGPTTGVIPSGSNSGSDRVDDQPLSINFKGVTLTPGGYFDGSAVWRQKALAADVNTPFNSIPFNGSSAASMSEYQASARESRITLRVQGKLSDVTIGGYYEMDFLGVGDTANNNQSNSYAPRVRQFWAQAAFNNGFTVTAGQQWSLIQETGHGMDNLTELPPQTIDAQQHVGTSWARQLGFRVTKNFNNKVWLGLAVEESQATLTVHGNPTAQAAAPVLACTTPGTNNCSTTGTYTLPINLNPTFVNFLVGAFGTSGGQYNPLANYQYNPSPDLVVKAVFEPGFGHYELFGLFDDFRDRTFPCVPLTGTALPADCPGTSITSGLGAINENTPGGGIGANARWSFFAKHVDFGIHFFGGSGIGRYGSGQLSDITIRPNGSIAAIHNFQTLGTVILHPVPKLDVYLYYGDEYDERTSYAKSGTTPNEGYGVSGLSNAGCWTETLPLTSVSTSTNLGVPTGVGGSAGFIPGALGSCNADTRNLMEGTIGFWYRFYKGPKGTFQYGLQYSNVYRNTWAGIGGGAVPPLSESGQPHSDENMVFTSFRYNLP